MSLYSKLLKNKRLDKYTSHLKRNRKKWTEEDMITEINNYEYLLDFIKQSHGCYLFIKRHKLEYLMINLKRKNREFLNDEIVKKEINKCIYLSDFRINYPRHYSYIKRRKKMHLIEHLTRHKNWVNRK